MVCLQMILDSSLAIECTITYGISYKCNDVGGVDVKMMIADTAMVI